MNDTKPTRSSAHTAFVTSWSQCSALTRPAGAPAAANARSKASATPGVRGECRTRVATEPRDAAKEGVDRLKGRPRVEADGDHLVECEEGVLLEQHAARRTAAVGGAGLSSGHARYAPAEVVVPSHLCGLGM